MLISDELASNKRSILSPNAADLDDFYPNPDPAFQIQHLNTLIFTPFAVQYRILPYLYNISKTF
jgi:hypothetical protein